MLAVRGQGLKRTAGLKQRDETAQGRHMGDCQNYGPFWGPYYNTGPNMGPNLGDPKRDHKFDNPPHDGIELGSLST